MDQSDVDPALLEKSLVYIRRINRVLGYTRATLVHLNRFARTWNGKKITILDVATGSGDIPMAVARWANRHGFDLRIIAIDLHPRIARAAVRQTAGEIHVVQANALQLPLADASVDYSMCNMFIHHLDEESIVQCLQEMGRVSRRGVIIADLLRSRRARWWIRIFSLFANPMIRHDAVASVEQALTGDEIMNQAHQAGLGFVRLHRHFAHRFVLAGEKPS